MRSIWDGLAAAVAAFVLSNPWSMAVANDNPSSKRSKALLPATLEMDRKAASTPARKSLPELRAVYRQLQEAADKRV